MKPQTKRILSSEEKDDEESKDTKLKPIQFIAGTIVNVAYSVFKSFYR